MRQGEVLGEESSLLAPQAAAMRGTNRSFTTLDDLEAAQTERCTVFQNEPEMNRSLTHFDWWPPAHSKQQ